MYLPIHSFNNVIGYQVPWRSILKVLQSRRRYIHINQYLYCYMISGMLELFPGHLKYMATREYLVRGKLLGAVYQVKTKEKMVPKQRSWVLLVCSSYMMCCALSFSHTRLFETPWTVARQAPLSMGILQARILEWVAMLSSRGSSNPGIQPRSPSLQAHSLPSEPPGKPILHNKYLLFPGTVLARALGSGAWRR